MSLWCLCIFHMFPQFSNCFRVSNSHISHCDLLGTSSVSAPSSPGTWHNTAGTGNGTASGGWAGCTKQCAMSQWCTWCTKFAVVCYISLLGTQYPKYTWSSCCINPILCFGSCSELCITTCAPSWSHIRGTAIRPAAGCHLRDLCQICPG